MRFYGYLLHQNSSNKEKHLLNTVIPKYVKALFSDSITLQQMPQSYQQFEHSPIPMRILKLVHQSTSYYARISRSKYQD